MIDYKLKEYNRYFKVGDVVELKRPVSLYCSKDEKNSLKKGDKFLVVKDFGLEMWEFQQTSTNKMFLISFNENNLAKLKPIDFERN